MLGTGILRKLRIFKKVNWRKTLYFNFKMFPFSIAKKLPVFFYGKVKFSSLKGEVTIQAPIRSGMIGFGQEFEKMTQSKGVAEIFIDGTLIFKGHAHFGKDVFLSIDKDAFCQFGFMGCLGSDVKLICTNKIIIGDWTGIGYESQIIDTNSHPMKNTITNNYYPMNGPIILGNYNAISNRVSIMLGTKTADNTVVASNSLCNKDYTDLGDNVLIGGTPSKLIKNNFKRDWEIEKEHLMKSKRVEIES